MTRESKKSAYKLQANTLSQDTNYQCILIEKKNPVRL